MAVAFFVAAFGLNFLLVAMRPAPGGFPPPVCETVFFDLGIFEFGTADFICGPEMLNVALMDFDKPAAGKIP
jgi:hypothetical protein